jgi:MFS transporter, DHA1 family, staphyloferrin B biosynthesis exporter
LIDRLAPASIRRTFRLDLTSSLLVGFFYAAVLNFVPVVARRLGADATQLALVVAAPLAGSLLTPLAVYVRPLHRFRFLVVVWGVARSLFLLTLFITRPVPFIIIVSLYYVLAALPLPVYVEIMGSVYPRNVRGRTMSYVKFGMTLVLTISTPIVGWMMDRTGYAVPFALGAVAGLISVLVFSRVRSGEFVTRHASLLQVIGILKHDRYFAIFSAALMFLGIGYLIGAPLFPIVQVDQLHLSYSDIGLLGLLSSGMWMLFTMVMGRLLDRKGALVVMLIANVLQMSIPLCYFLATDVRMVALAFICTGISMAGGDLAWPNSVLLFAQPDKVGDYTTLYMLLLGARGVIGPVIGAALLSSVGLPLHTVLFISFAVQVIGVAIMVWVLRTYRSERISVSKDD